MEHAVGVGLREIELDPEDEPENDCERVIDRELMLEALCDSDTVELPLGDALRENVAEEQKETDGVVDALIEPVALEHEETLDERLVEPE